MKTRLLVSLLLVSAARFLCAENEIGFIEKFALATDREAVLSQLIPGSEEFYFYHALHFQNTAQAAKLTATMAQWAAKFPHSEQRKIIENRAALLAYDADPKATLAFLRDRLNLQFNHEQEVRDKKPDLPTALDQALISREAFQREALRDSDDLARCDDAALERFVREKVALTPPQKRALLSRIQRPNLPGLVELIEADLRTNESKGFGEFPIHKALLPEQLDQLANRLPTLFGTQAFVFARLRKLLPSADADVEFDPVEREAWLERIWTYAKNLSPSFNTLKAHILHLRLLHDRTRGTYDRARFLEYLKLPRRAAYVRTEYLQRADRAESAIDLNADLGEALGSSPPIGNDEWLVREFLLELLKDEKSWEPFAVYLRDEFLKPLFAESKITHGIGEPEQWSALLSPTAFQALKDRVDIDFAPANPLFHAPADAVALDVFVKNAPKLIVKIYEVNALSFFLAQNRQLNTDLQLDGLVANAEKTHEFKAPPLLRTARKFEFPELANRRGAWVIEFIGGGKSSRVLIRKGQWHLLQQTGPAGDMLSVIDEARQPVANAVVWLDGRKFTPDEKSGRIIVPFTNQPGNKPIILADPAGEFATLTSFEHHAENYRLDAQFFVAREQLLAGREATLGIRAALLVGDTQIAPSLLQDAKLAITSTTLDGISTTREITGLTFDPAKVSTHTITVPDRLAQLTVTLTAKVESLSTGGEKKDVSATRSWSLNGIDKTAHTADAHFARIGGGYVLDLLGKNGEPLPDQQIVFTFRHREFRQPISIPLRSDERGRIDLGALDDEMQLVAALPDGHTRSWMVEPDGAKQPGVIHATAGSLIEVPWFGGAGPLRQADVSLLERRGDSFAADRFDALSLGRGFLQIKGLAPGDYSLRIQASREEVTIRVTAGSIATSWLISPNRQLELRNPAPLQIESIREDADSLLVQLRNANSFTRVHVAATRFHPGQDQWLSDLGDFSRPEPELLTPARRPNLFAAGRPIGDEFRYILERRYAKIFPGNMLTRPGLLLNPWDVRSTEVAAQSMEAGQAAGASRGDRAEARRKAPASPMEAATAFAKTSPDAASPGADLDFLAAAAPVFYNLVPDKNGVVSIPRKLLGDRQQVQVYAEDLSSAVHRSFALAEAPAKFQDLRLTRNLDPQKPFSERKEVSLLAGGQTLTLPDILTSELETYDSLASIYALFTTLSGDANLAKFAWILEWPKLKDEEKRAKYSEFACHELNVFLSRKDPDFFAKVVQPYLRNKKEKTFLDEWLLETDLSRFLEPWNFARLNAAERALLARRLPAASAGIARHLRETFDLLPPNPDQENRWFETALRGRAMSGGDEFGFAGAKKEAEVAAVAFDSPASPALAPAPMSAAKAMPQEMKGRMSLDSAVAGRQVDQLERLADERGAKEARAGVEVQLQEAEKDKNNLAYFGVLGVEDATRMRGLVRQFYRKLGATKEWAENNYYRLPLAQQTAELIPVNAFWRDYAAWDGKSPFLSKNVAEASRNFSEIMLALAVLDLPFESPKHATKTLGREFTMKTGGPLIAFHKEIKPAEIAPQETELLVSENFFRADDRERMEGNEKFDKYVSGEFIAGVVYGANVVVTNPTSAPQKLELLIQIPRGALPVLGSKATDSKRVRLEPYTTQRLEYFFYFPAPAAEPMAHYPVHVSRDEKTAGAAKQFAFTVVRQLSKPDTASWDFVSQYGSEEEVFAFLAAHNLERLNLERVAWRARKSVEFFRKLLGVLAQRHVYNDVLQSYAVAHNETAALREWLRHRDDFLAQCGPWLATPLITIDPIERRAFEQLEYSPLINQRGHRLGAENRIANPVARAQYQALLRILAHKPALDAMDRMSVVYFLFLQDRTEEALALFPTIKPDELPTRIQHDYFRCYADFFESKLADARTIAAGYATHPVDRWRKLFTDVTAQLDEIEGKGQPPAKPDAKPNREGHQSELASTEPAFDFKIEAQNIALTWKNLPEVTINFYLMDPEFLFSSSPFVTQDPGRFSIIKPSKTVRQVLPAGKDALDVPLPAEFARANVLIEILGAGQRKAQAHHANTLRLSLVENYGRLELRDQAANQPVSKAYVKVYARLKNGQIRFFKDGYTDLRGRFDYASLNSSEHPATPVPLPRTAAAGGATLDYQMLRPTELGDVEKLAILIMSETNGALVREANPPSE